MFQEKRLIFQEIPPRKGAEKMRNSNEWLKNLSKNQELITPKEFLKQGAEKEKSNQEQEIKVQEKMLNDLEIMQQKCPRCSSINIRQSNSPPFSFYCDDCGHNWQEPATPSAVDKS